MNCTALAGREPHPGIARIRGLAGVAACLLFAGGCALTSQETGSKDMLFDRDGVDIVTTSSSRQMVMIKDSDSVERFCRGPEPDSSLMTSGGVSLSLPVGMGARSIGGQAQQDSLALGGRSPAVLITREILYRACELAMNINADAEKTLAIYREFLQIARQIAETQTQAGSQAVSSKPAPSADDKDDDSDDKSDEKSDDKDAGKKKK
jgi:hypothetical protein